MTRHGDAAERSQRKRKHAIPDLDAQPHGDVP
ncbi:MAG: hypothetical protein JWO31_839, partial [Phycisphaerales bacterium]|nr:hypothetical protein [Phycisphaerales bacterium]